MNNVLSKEKCNIMSNPLKPYLKDILIICIITLTNLIIVLVNLGSSHVPNTSWQPVNAGENFIISFGKVTDISRISYFWGYNERKLDGSKFRILYSDRNGRFLPLTILEKKDFTDFYTWKYMDVSLKTDRIKIVTNKPGGTINEIGFFEKGSCTPLKGLEIANKKVDINDRGSVENLIDEQSIIPFNPSYINSSYYDEIYHARTAYEYLNKLEPFETTHPPLGKAIIAFGIYLFGMNPFGWRIFGALFGTAMVPLMYLFGLKVFKSRFFAFCTSFLMMFDFMHFSESRIAALDIYVTFFVILMYYYMYDYFSNKSYETGFKKSLLPLFLSGLAFGLGVACKWIALYGAAGIFLALLLAKYNEYKDYKNITANRTHKKNPWVKDFIPLYLIRTMIFCAVFFIVIPCVIYILSYIPFMTASGNGFSGILKNQSYMLDYHTNLVSTHPYSSPWWSWPLDLKPMLFCTVNNSAAGKMSTIVSMGNPVIWWIGIPALIAACIIASKKRDKSMIVIFTAFVFQYLPWAFVTRVLFIQHFFSAVPFMILAIVYVLKNTVERYPKFKYAVIAYLAVTAALFIIFYPVLSGLEVNSSYIEHLRWLGTWTFSM